MVVWEVYGFTCFESCLSSPGWSFRFSKGSDDMSRYIVGISKPSNKESGTEITEGLVLDVELVDRVFKVPITTVKCIPHGCRLAFSQALKSVLCKVVAQPDSIEAWSLATWGKDDGITTLVKSILDGSALGSFGQGGGDFIEEGATGNTNIKQCLRKVTDGQFTAVVKVLSSSGVAPYCDDTIKALEAKHPYKPLPSMPSITFFYHPLIAEIDSVFSCIKSFSKGTSCGRDGLKHILDALCGEGSATATYLLKVITSVFNFWLAGRCSPILAEFVASAPLMPLLKPDNGIRPIAVGTIWRRLVSKVSMKGMGKEMSKYLSDFQFGVGVAGGAMAILHSVNWVLSEYHNDGSLAMLTVDFWIDRHYSTSCKLLFHTWYLDDGTVIGDSKEVARVLYIIKVSGPGLGLELNIKKTKIFWPLCNGMKLREGLFSVDIRRSSSGVKLLGGAVSRGVDFISGLTMRRAANDVDLMGLLPQLHDPQNELLLLRKLFFV
ncbi:hypothetical protein Tco_0840086 [Tanacetum coccineum]|uniref:Reverse transcriptase domain-containing protein n=1 Tax=Tanacetum coccineum TaxID=301880 RepID=A0ABQ5AX00_9ASTR